MSSSTRRIVLVATLLAPICAAVPAEAARLVRQPYLQLMTTESVTVVWKTDVAARCSLALRPLGETTTVVSGSVGTTCVMALTGLRQGTEYGYVPRADGTALLAESVFHTDDPNAPFSFLVIGDSGTGGASQLAVRDRMRATPADFIVHTGDMVYDDGATADFDPKFFRPYQDLLRKMVLWPTLGNHDIHTSSGGPWRTAFWTPANNPTKSENYYSFRYGNAQVVVLNSNGNLDPGDPQYVFLESELAASNATWKFVAFHHPLYSSGEHGSSLGLRASLVPVFDRHGVDIVFMGHDHDYERTVPLRGDVEVPAGQGTIYVTTGGAGQRTRAVATNPWTAYVESALHYTRVAIDGDRLILHMIRSDGTVGDALTLTKGATPPAPRCGDGIVNPGVEQCDGGDLFACGGPCTARCTCAPFCGDGVRNESFEQCDGDDDAACPDRCLVSCRCGLPGHFMTLAPAADTYIQAGLQASWDHGASPELDVDRSPSTMSFLKFDLTKVGAPVTRATLSLACINPSADGGVVYPVDDSSWIEGDRTGLDLTSAGGPGLKWTDVDTNGNGTLDDGDTSLWMPDLTRMTSMLSCVKGQRATIDVTDALAGAGSVSTVAIRNGSGDGASYASRDDADPADHPRLRLELSFVPVTTTTTTLKTTTTTSTSTTTSTTTSTSTSTTSTSTTSTLESTTTSTVEPTSTSTSTSTSTTAPPTTTTTVRPTTTIPAPTTTSTSTSSSTSTAVTTTTTIPGPTTTTLPQFAFAIVQADVTVKEAAPDTNFGAAPLLEADTSPASRILLRIGVAGVRGRPVSSVRLRLHVADVVGAPSDSGGRIRRLQSCSWYELTTTWNNQPALDGEVIDEMPAVVAGDSVEFELRPAIADDGLYCFALETDSADGVVYTSRNATAARPVVIVALASGQPTSTSTVTTSTLQTSSTTTLPPPVTDILADTTVRDTEPDRNLGAAQLLEADAAPQERTFVRAQVSGLGGRRVTRALFHFKVAAPTGSASNSGGRIRRIADCNWSEMGTTWNSMPSLTGTVLDTAGAVSYGDTVAFDVTSAITVNGVYCFAIDTTSDNAVMYTSRETTSPPQLVVETTP